MPSASHAEVPLNRAVIASLRNAVELILKNQAPRSAKVNDALVPGDAIATARAALAELRFNDGSLARVGGQALFRFLPNTRTFQISNGTLLLLVPPGRGKTQVQTPNAAAGIRGSALFVRYLPETDVTIIGALTDSGIEITNRDRAQTQSLGAGQIVVIVKNRIEQIYRFDLKTFYDTSELVKGLDLQRPALNEQAAAPTDPAIAAVRAETSEAVKIQTSLGSFSEVTATDSQPSDANARAPQRNQPTSTSSTTLNQATEASRTIALPTDHLLVPPTAAFPSAFPSTVALPPGLPGGNSPAIGAPTSELGSPPGLAGTTTGRSGSLPPGLAGTAPGLAGTTPGQSGSPPPGQANTTPGLAP
ncbi:FecR domain-containing protein [Stenomitos frigidus]|uniref:FecR domain-containing protein n=1 Tax=Stenomitos frigidus TaxID=1886765 RepID=UPI001C62ADEB|nr:FecR domain-containing protein [Stenomitos frigidus]